MGTHQCIPYPSFLVTLSPTTNFLDFATEAKTAI